MSKKIKRTICLGLAMVMLLSLFGGLPATAAGKPAQAKDYVGLVDTYIESNAGRFFFYNSAGNPYGMVKPHPDDNTSGAWGSGNRYSASSTVGISHLHDWQISGVQIMPTNGNVDPTGGQEAWRSAISHEKETAQPGYHQIYLDRYDIDLEVAATDRVAIHRYTYQKGGAGDIMINLSPGDFGEANIKSAHVTAVGRDNKRLEGYLVEQGVLSYYETKIYFVIDFEQPFDALKGWRGGSMVNNGNEITENSGPGMGVVVHYDDIAEGDQLQLKVALSITGTEGAENNMRLELDHWDFDRVRSDSQRLWNEMLGRIDVEGGTHEEQVKFYTDLFHVLCGRSKISDADGKYLDNTWGAQRVGQLPLDRAGKPVYNMYNYDALWLNQWTLNTVLGMAYPDVYEEFVQSQLRMYQDGGILPRGPSAGNYSFVMTSATAIPFIVSAYNKGIQGFDIGLAYDAMVDAASVGGLYDKSGYEYRTWDGTGGALEYMTMGYVPYDMEGGQNHNDGASNTMEFSYEDYCIAQIARQLGRTGVNIAQTAKVKASSEKAGPNEEYYSARRAIDGRPRRSGLTTDRGAYNVEWASREANPWIELSWDTPQTVNKVVLSDRLASGSFVNSGVIRFSDGTQIDVTDLPQDGSDQTVAFDPKTIEWLRFEVTGGTGREVGLNEIEVWNTEDAYTYYMDRSSNWKNLYDYSGFIRPKGKDGNWLEDFDPLDTNQFSTVGIPGNDFCEANSWQYTWFATHDVIGLANLLGGREAYAEKLHNAFSEQAPDFAGGYGTGYINYGNQPGVYQAHLFNYVGKPWLSQYWVRQVKQKVFSGTTPNSGYGGHDEDQGHMSCISLLMAMGLFEVDGGVGEKPIYELTAPIFDRITIELHPEYYKGGQFEIVSHGASAENVYIQSAELHGEALDNCWFYHEDLAKGGRLELWLGDTPNYDWGVAELPPSVSAVQEVPIENITLADCELTTPNAKATMQPQITPADASYTKLDWSVTDLSGRPTSLAEIDDTGLLCAGTLPGQVLVTAKAKDGTSAAASAVITLAPDMGKHANGLLGEYFVVRDIGGIGTGDTYPYGLEEGNLKTTQIEDDINYRSFDDLLLQRTGQADNAGVRWTGYIQPEQTGDYLFMAKSDDGCMLYIDGEKVIDYWKAHDGSGVYAEKRVHLEKGKQYAFQCEYLEYKGGARMQLFWSAGEKFDQENVPPSVFYLPDGVKPPVQSPAQAIGISTQNGQTCVAGSETTLQLTAAVTPSNAPQKVYWSVQSPGGGKTSAAQIDQNGILKSLQPGAVVVTAAAVDGSGVIAKELITIVPEVDADLVDIASGGNNAVTFGRPQEAYRYQTFYVREGFTGIGAVTLKLLKQGSPSDLLVEIYETDSHNGYKPIGQPLAGIRIQPKNITSGVPFTAPMACDGLTEGKMYALVLSAEKLDDGNNYAWFCSASDNGDWWKPEFTGNPQIKQDDRDLYAGKQENGQWVDESRLGDMWVQVNCISQSLARMELDQLYADAGKLDAASWTPQTQQALRKALDGAKGFIENNVGQLADVLHELRIAVRDLEPSAEWVLAAAKAAAEAAVAHTAVSNDTTADEILSVVRRAVDNGSVTAEWSQAFRMEKATNQAEGRITGVITLAYSGQLAQVTIALAIPQLDTPIVRGDLTKDGKVNISDVMAACKILARKSMNQDPTEDEIARGDMNGDTKITITDVMAICKILADKA